MSNLKRQMETIEKLLADDLFPKELAERILRREWLRLRHEAGLLDPYEYILMLQDQLHTEDLEAATPNSRSTKDGE